MLKPVSLQVNADPRPVRYDYHNWRNATPADDREADRMLRADLQLLQAVLAGRSLPEVAAASGQSETAVRTRLQQLLRRLRETALKEQTEGQEP